jgi:hypothetical protein
MGIRVYGHHWVAIYHQIRIVDKGYK